MLEEFKKFAMRGNVVDLAVGVIIGVAFGAIVTSFVQDIIMPIIGAVTGGLDFSNYYLRLSSTVQEGAAYADAKKQGAVVGYGQFLTVALNFLIVAWVLFLVIRAMNRMRRNEDEKADVSKAPEIPAEVKLLSEIRDILASASGAGQKRPAL
jgi:large conductance mechanosensitive channel